MMPAFPRPMMTKSDLLPLPPVSTDQFPPYIEAAGHELKPNSKAPSTPKGHNDAPTEIRSGHNVGISLALTDLIVLDVDCKHYLDGHDSIKDAGHHIPETLKVVTPSGGAHYYYTRPKEHKPQRSCNALANIDVLSNGYVVAPPSEIHSKPYEIDDDTPIAPAPQWLLDLNQPKGASSQVEYDERDETIYDQGWQCATAEQIQEYLQSKAPVAVKGENGHTTLLTVARHLYWGYMLSADDCVEALWRWYNSRCNPPWQMTDGDAGDFARKVSEVANSGSENQPGYMLQFVAPQWMEDFITGLAVSAEPTNMPSIEVGMQNMPRSQEEAVKARPPVIIDGLLYQGGKLLVGAPAKAGKSHFTMGLFAALANASQFLQWHSSKQLKVLYIDFELMEFELRERMLKAFNYNVPDNASRLSLRKYADVRSPKKLEEVLSHLDVDQFDVVVFDCLYKFNDAEDENANSAMKDVCSWLDGVADKYKFAAIVIHHFGKGAQSGKSIVDRFRGGSALAGDFDALMAIAEHEEDEHFIIESEVRSFKKTSPFVARWDYPHFVLADDMDATKHLDKGGRKGIPDSELLKNIPFGEDKAKRFGQLGINLTKDAFNKRVTNIKGVKTCKKINSNKRNETHYYREKTSNGLLIAG